VLAWPALGARGLLVGVASVFTLVTGR